jgi:hypothetical protein
MSQGTGYSGDGGGLAMPSAQQVEAIASSLAAALVPQLQLQGGGAAPNPLDLLKIGMGLGIGLGAGGRGGGGGLPSGMMGGANVDLMPSISTTSGSQVLFVDSASMDDTGMTSSTGNDGRVYDAEARVAQERAARLGHPIGVAHPTISGNEGSILDHSAENAQRDATKADTANGLTTADQFKGIHVVDLTPTPDENVTGDNESYLKDRKTEIVAAVPVVAHPELVQQGFMTHGVAGIGNTFVKDGDGDAQTFLPESAAEGLLLRRSADPLPEGFFKAIHATHVGKAQVDYLPSVPNLPQTCPVGRIKPRSAAEDWLAIGFDPWSAGKEPLSFEFIASLSTKDDTLLENQPQKADDSFIDIMDRQGLADQQEEAAQQSKLASDFAQLASWARHGKYAEIEDAMNQSDWTLPIDYQDELGNTLLQIAVQNGNKRISKLCLRRGADINKQNLSGQTVLHYAFSYGFDDVAEYLQSKGADDSVRNADGLTCYEGLSIDDVAGI